MLDKEFPSNDQRKYPYEVDLVYLNSMTKETKKVRADKDENAIQHAIEGHSVWMIGMTVATLKEYYLKKDIVVKDVRRIYGEVTE